MEWTLIEEIKRRAEISDEEALNVSIESWEQKCEALRQGGSIVGHLGTGNCGLCQRYNQDDGCYCPGCVLEDGNDESSCCKEYQAVSANHTLPNAQAMLNRLYQEKGKILCKKEAKKECKKEKQELRHGDYGYSPISTDQRLYAGGIMYGISGSPNTLTKPDMGIPLGNIFDDLERNAEDLKRWGSPNANGYNKEGRACRQSIIMERCEDNTIWLGTCGNSDWYSFDQATEIHQKLGQVIATAKRQEAKKDC